MTQSFGDAIAKHYFVDDLPGSKIPGARLQNILDWLQLGRQVTRYQIEFLQKQGLEAMCQLATNKLTHDSFQELAIAEQAIRIEAVIAAKLAFEVKEFAQEVAARKQADEARLIRERDPQYIAKIQNQELRTRFRIDAFVKPHVLDRLMSILKGIDSGQRLGENDYVWLSSVAEEYFSRALRIAYHKLEANFFVSEYGKTSDPWAAVNASKHYRKCDCAVEASSILSTIDVERQKSPKLKSALCTTYGGVMRDLGQRHEAVRLGLKAHEFSPRDYHPCTLLGAIYMEIGDYAVGQEWYVKAIDRGATVDSVDQDLRKIFFRADHARQMEMREFLLHEDPVRFSWAGTNRHDS